MKQIDLEKNLKQPVLTELKSEHRFKVVFPQYMNFPDYVEINCKKPKFKNDKWKKMKFEFVDPINNSTSQPLFHLITNKLNNNEKEKFIEIIGLDKCGIEIEKWVINFEKFKVDFGKCDNLSDYANVIKLTIFPKTCQLLF
jgi:hypothetical protein